MYLFGIRVGGGGVTVTLAVDGGVSAAADSVHLPLGEIVVDHVDVAESATWHALDQTLAEVVERNGDLHASVGGVLIVVSQEHDLVVVGEVVVGNGNCGGTHYGVDQAVRAVREGAVVDPDLPGAEDGDAVAVRSAPPPNVSWAGAYVGVPRGRAVVDVDVVDDDVGDVLERDAAVAGDVDVGAATVDGFEAVEDELVLQVYGHVGGEHDPERLVLDDRVPKRARDRVGRVAVGGVGHHVDLSALPAHGIFAEADAAVGELLAVGRPVGVAAPAVVDWVSGETRALLVLGQCLPSP